MVYIGQKYFFDFLFQYYSARFTDALQQERLIPALTLFATFTNLVAAYFHQSKSRRMVSDGHWSSFCFGVAALKPNQKICTITCWPQKSAGTKNNQKVFWSHLYYPQFLAEVCNDWEHSKIFLYHLYHCQIAAKSCRDLQQSQKYNHLVCTTLSWQQKSVAIKEN